MRAQLISDLHTEFYVKPMGLATKIPIAPSLDVLIIAGDLVVPARQNLKNVKLVLDYFSSKARHVIYVEGNHEYYGASREQARELLQTMLPKNYIWLDNSDVTIDGVHFYGGAMWFKKDPLNQLYEEVLSDFSQIRGNFREWVYEENTKFRENAMKLVTPETVVVTHHLPSMRSVPLEFLNSQTNRFFVSDETYLITEKQPRYWFHGHTHRDCTYFLGDTQVVCYPFGYPGERRTVSEKQQKYEPEVFDL